MDREFRTRWTDERLDDMHSLVMTNDDRLDRTISRTDNVESEVTQIMKTGDRRSDRNWALKLALFTVSISSFATLIVTLLHSH